MVSLELWWLFPASIVIATIAMSTGIGGAVFFSPIFLIILKLDPAIAIGTALITEFFGFSSGVIAYLRQSLIDFRVAAGVLMFSVPAAVLGAASADVFPGTVPKAIFATGIIFIGAQIFTSWWGERRAAMADQPEPEGDVSGYPIHVLVDRSGRRFEYRVFKRPAAMVFGGVGGAFLGMISVGLAELLEYQLLAKCRVPAPVAVATSVFVVIVSVAAASVGRIVAFVGEGPEVTRQVFSVVMFTAPGVVIGGQIGPQIQRVLEPEKVKVFVSIMFAVIGTIMLVDLAI